ncbi:DHA2 family efflux MFS transporter permease subunit [Streptomyces sp. NPDC005483]|uniref:DHA2 family efflux MFS transporter permease subunit n=1 Tax=Streptomyces sp. NPDC005483 TaxID=3154882 RepID=UPI0033B5559D
MSTDSARTSTGATPAAPQPSGLSPEVRRIAVVVVTGAVASLLDSTIVNIALNDLTRELHTGLDTVQWVVTAYLLALASVIPVTGWAARRVGARRLYLASIVLFTLASVACGFAQTSGQLIALRALQGIGGGLTLPVGQMILARKAGPQNMARVMSVVGIPMVLTPVVGPTIGGLLLDGPGWRWIFFVNLPIGLIAVLLGLRLLPREPAENAGPLDATGLVAISLGMIGLTYGLAELGNKGEFTTAVVASLAAGLVLTAAFVVHALRTKPPRRPLLDLHLYRDKAFAAACVATFALGGAMYGGMILMPLYYQAVRHEDAVTTGLLLGPSGFGAAAAMWLAGRTSERIGGGLTAIIGGVVNIVSTLPFVLIGPHTSYVALCLALVVRGFGIGMSMMPAMTAAYRVLGRNKVNDATPQLSILQRVGGSMGTAIIVVVLQNSLADSDGTPAGLSDSFGTAFGWVLVVTLVALLATAVLAAIERPVFAAQRAQKRQAAAQQAATGKA